MFVENWVFFERIYFFIVLGAAFPMIIGWSVGYRVRAVAMEIEL